jgi:hypothetical protein
MLLGAGPLVGIAKAGHLWVVYDSTGRDLATAGSKQEAIRKARFIARLLEAGPTHNPAGALRYFMLHIYEKASDRGKVSPQTLTRLLPSRAEAKVWAQQEISKYGGVGYLYSDPSSHAGSQDGYTKPLAVFRSQNPIYSRIPPRWTPARVWRGEKGQIHALIGGRQ